MTALDDLTDLVSSLPNAALLTTKMKQTALDGSVVPDSRGVWPGQEGYLTTYDIYFAAVKLLAFLQAQPVVRQVSSEGTSTAVDAPNWAALIGYYRSMSPIAMATAGGVLTEVVIPGGPHVVRTNMSGRGTDDVDVDTDVS